MDDSQEQTQTQPPAAAGAPSSETASLGDRVLLPAGKQLEDQVKDQAEDRSRQ